MALQPLKPGAVEPTGWLRDWALSARKGITGHLDERAETYAKGWSGQDFKAGGVKEKGTGWPLEQCAYWLDGLVRLAYILNDPDMIAKAKFRLDPVVDGVLKGGDSFVYWMPKSIFNDDGFNSWAHSHMGRALVAYYQASGDPRILEALVKVYRNFPLLDFQDDFGVVNGMVNLDPMIDTYLLSRDPQVLANIRSVLERPGFKKAVETWSSGKIVPGHAVIFYENLRVPALLYPLTGDRQLLNATERTVEWSDQSYLLPLGLVSGEEHLAGIGSTRNVETCNVAAANWTFISGSSGSRARGDMPTASSRFFSTPVRHRFPATSRRCATTRARTVSTSRCLWRSRTTLHSVHISSPRSGTPVSAASAM